MKAFVNVYHNLGTADEARTSIHQCFITVEAEPMDNELIDNKMLLFLETAKSYNLPLSSLHVVVDEANVATLRLNNADYIVALEPFRGRPSKDEVKQAFYNHYEDCWDYLHEQLPYAWRSYIVDRLQTTSEVYPTVFSSVPDELKEGYRKYLLDCVQNVYNVEYWDEAAALEDFERNYEIE